MAVAGLVQWISARVDDGVGGRGGRGGSVENRMSV